MRYQDDGSSHRFQGQDGVGREPPEGFDPEPIEVWCPYCQTPAGEPCRTMGAGTPRAEPHAPREEAATQAERVGRDPADAWCPHCEAEPREVCRTVGGNSRGHHTRRGAE